MSNIGILHPGEMGVSIAASALRSGHQVYWASQSRSNLTRERAQTYGLIESDSLHQLCRKCDVVISICPPHAAEEVAKSVSEAGFQGVYLDANAISPQRAVRIGEALESNNIRFVDGSVIGGPAWKPKETWLYLSGEHADVIVSCFVEGPLETKIIGRETGKASALKMCYAAYTKGTTALLCAILAAAESLAVRDELYQQWEIDEAGFSEQVNQRVLRTTRKAWRFEGEMDEIACTFHEAGLPDGFHAAAAEGYRRMALFKGSTQTTALDNVLRALLNS